MAREHYSVYRLTSPSGRAYVGFTGQRVAARWGQHVRRALKGAKHPLCAAIRKYGSARFTVEILSAHPSLDAALKAEVRAIAVLEKPYNISPGGDFDGAAGHRRLAELFTDRVWRAEYVASLSSGCKASSAHRAHWLDLTRAAEQWRKGNPAKAYKNALRALRIGQRSRNKKTSGASGRLPRKPKGLAARKMKSMRSRAAAKRHWANMPEDKKANIHARIAKAVTQHHESMTPVERRRHSAQLAEARKNIDHSLRKKNQKIAIAAYWTPERRAAFGAAVRARNKEKRDADV